MTTEPLPVPVCPLYVRALLPVTHSRDLEAMLARCACLGSRCAWWRESTVSELRGSCGATKDADSFDDPSLPEERKPVTHVLRVGDVIDGGGVYLQEVTGLGDGMLTIKTFRRNEEQHPRSDRS